jgi:hypothetical protein
MRPVVEQLNAATADLEKALAAADLPSAEQSLQRRDSALDALRHALRDQPLPLGQLDRLAQAFQDGQQAVQTLIAFQASTRQQLAELSALRHRLSSWAPNQPETDDRLDLTA